MLATAVNVGKQTFLDPVAVGPVGHPVHLLELVVPSTVPQVLVGFRFGGHGLRFKELGGPGVVLFGVLCYPLPE